MGRYPENAYIKDSVLSGRTSESTPRFHAVRIRVRAMETNRALREAAGRIKEEEICHFQRSSSSNYYSVSGEPGNHYPKLAEIIDDQIAHHTDAIVICGTTGESSTLTHEEHLEAIRFTVEHVAGRVPVIAGTGSNCTETAIYLSTEAEKYGADALLVVTPYYNKATQKGLIAHYTAIAESVNLPIIMYNVPSRTGCNIQPETRVPGEECEEYRRHQGGQRKYLPDREADAAGGRPDRALFRKRRPGGADHGARWTGRDFRAVQCGSQQTHDMVAKFLEGDVAGSREIQLKALPLIDALFCEVNPIPVKAAMNMMGWEAGPLRMPLTEMEPQNQERLRKAMIDFGIEVK